VTHDHPSGALAGPRRRFGGVGRWYPAVVRAPSAETTLSLVIPPDPAKLHHVRRAVREMAPRLVAPERVADVMLAVSEAVNNAILHARQPAVRADEPIRVRLAASRDHLCVDVVDRGGGFAPGERAPRTTGLGIGLWLIDRLADRARVESGSEGTRVTMCFAAQRRPETC